MSSAMFLGRRMILGRMLLRRLRPVVAPTAKTIQGKKTPVISGNIGKRPTTVRGGATREIRQYVRGLVGRYPCDIQGYKNAFSHKSARMVTNERLECLGDSVLGLVACEYLYRTYPDINEGLISRLRVKLVNGAACTRSTRGLLRGRRVTLDTVRNRW